MREWWFCCSANCLPSTNLSEFVSVDKICQCSGAPDNFIHCGNPPWKVPKEAKYVPDSGGRVGGWLPRVCSALCTSSSSSPQHPDPTLCLCHHCRSFGSQRRGEYVSDFLGGGTYNYILPSQQHLPYFVLKLWIRLPPFIPVVEHFVFDILEGGIHIVNSTTPQPST